MDKISLKFKKNESFYIRDGWFEKALNTIEDSNGTNIFHKNDGIRYLGIGSNMVKGLKYWLQASQIIESTSNQLTEFGQLIYKYDKYFDTSFTWFLVHYYLVTDKEYCPVFYGFFNNTFTSIQKNNLVEYLLNFYKDENVNKSYIDADVSVFLKSYYNDEIIENPEDNYVCPLSELGLLDKQDNEYKKVKPTYNSLSYLIIYYALSKIYKFKSFRIEDSFKKENSPFLIFNLDKNMYLQYFDEMKNHGLVTVNKTAGLNVVYFEKKLKLNDIFDIYFRR